MNVGIEGVLAPGFASRIAPPCVSEACFVAAS